ncbi:phage terminase large subunit GpA-like protein [Pedobacter sp. AK013]|uniref:terminase gpA endonuclease subunit n=1 Tax=Pedobacter sp. AK013 TaxID=2723071 RepID=UPI0016158329|nr:terminase gpA endonuclease subunit [Pedobacter sp. AK013]MBB6236503.1 phage terminase large subunit GpA-like protein [Pedobacter sp. AK013]
MVAQFINDDLLAEQWLQSYLKANEDIFDFKIIKPEIIAWIESNIKLPRTSSEYSGHFSYDLTPYWKEPVSHMHPNSPVRTISIMKCVQSGATESVIIPVILYSMSEDPCSMLLTAGDLSLAKDTVEKRIDPVILESGLSHLLRPHVVKRANNRSGDTGESKEFIGGSFRARGTQSATAFRQFPAKKVWADDYDAAPRELGKEGSVRGLIEGRQNSFGDKAKSNYISTPTETLTSNINEMFMLGTQKAWHWPCPHCGTFVKVEFKIEREDGNIAGIVWSTDNKNRLIPSSVAFMCPNCANTIQEKSKYELNINGIWVPGTDSPVERLHESYHFCGLALPAGFTGWVKIVEEFLQANPPGGRTNVKKLKTWNNLRMGLPFAETGETPRVNELMQNTRKYFPGVVPDVTCAADCNGSIIMLTLACDLNGIMDKDNEDVRLDWEILAHTTTGATYSVDHGSIGTFKRLRERTKEEQERDFERDKWTLTHNVKNSVWDTFEEVIKKEYPMEGGNFMSISITVVDTGFSEKLAMSFIQKMKQDKVLIYGVKGRTEATFRKIGRDTSAITRAKEHPNSLYILEVNQMKDDLAQMMKLREGSDGSQPNGFMNFPESRDGKYTMKSYFSHYEGERRTEEIKEGNVLGFKWDKKNSSSQNHFWDVRIYNNAAPMIYLDVLKRSDPRYKMLTWEDFVMLVSDL